MDLTWQPCVILEPFTATACNYAMKRLLLSSSSWHTCKQDQHSPRTCMHTKQDREEWRATSEGVHSRDLNLVHLSMQKLSGKELLEWKKETGEWKRTVRAACLLKM
ncbi:hypothetical protein GOP47_0025508 [Adiantum capillus-veneris]|uniref:Uncharacterized protein n=1 Tax=Adiantum capillus-veneris TaxID=13818 RepID=A0A9D4U287_ADICA|nr:hypothetical protein GOP47_0025508 [Adiantum capillus-veneris]